LFLYIYNIVDIIVMNG